MSDPKICCVAFHSRL